MTSLRERTFPNGLLEIIVHLGERYSVVEEHGMWMCPTACVTGVQLGHLLSRRWSAEPRCWACG